MKFHFLPRTKQVQRFRALSSKLGKMVEDGSFQELSKEKQLKLANRLFNLFRQVGALFSSTRLRRTLGAAAVLVSLAGAVQAQNFAAPVEMTFGLVDENTPIFHFADIDNDGDLDAFMSVYGEYSGDRTLGYQENIGSAMAPAFDTLVEVPFGITINFGVTTVDFADVDVDGDLDLFLGSYNLMGDPAPIYGWENTGTGQNPVFNLSPAQNPFNFQPSASISELVFADLDGDADPDILMNNYISDTDPENFRYQENLGIMGTFPEFGAVQIDPFGLSNTTIDRIIMDFGDMDLDGDLDLMVGGRVDIDSYAVTDFYFYENTGDATSPAFAAAVTNPFNLQVPPNTYILVPALVDIDGDGDLDIFASTYESENGYESVLFWENLGGNVNTQEVSAVNDVKVFPTVAEDVLHWELNAQETLGNVNFRIVNLNGSVSQAASMDLHLGLNQGVLNVSNLASGMHVLQMTDERGVTLSNQRFFVK
jgi:hypothetical protein